MIQNPFYKLVAKIILLLAGTILLCRWTRGYGLFAVAAAVAYFAMTERTGALILTAMFLPFLVMVNPVLMPRYGSFAQIARLSAFFAQTMLVLAGALRPGPRQIPLGGIFLYFIPAALSSIAGYFPLISFFKIANFIFFALSIYIGTRNIDNSGKDLLVLRAGMLAFGFLLIYGSLLTLPFPSMAYYTSLKYEVHRYGAAYADFVFQNTEGATTLFTGITVQSQFLGPALACMGAWLLCDMLFVEHGLGRLHIALLLPIPAMLYMTRARIGLLTMAVALVTIYFYCFPRMRMASAVRRQVFLAMVVFALVVLGVGIYGEAKGGYISKWLRKTENVLDDDRTVAQAVTDSRQGTIGMCLRDFRRNRLLGKGFQVVEEHRELYKDGQISLFSAPIEKGVLPIMVLGETGIVGGAAFLLFLFHFFLRCLSKSYIATSTLFAVLLATNMAEATFFSPGGGGGSLWMICVVGGFVIDLTVQRGDERMIQPYGPSKEGVWKC